MTVTAIVGVAAVAWLCVGGGYPNFDTAYASVWGRELVSGTLPDYNIVAAPTPHPLATAVGALTALLGGGAYDALAVLTYLSFGALVQAVYVLGRVCYSWRVGLLGALIIGTSFTVLSRTAASYFDLLTVGLIVLAAAFEASGRRGAPVLVLLGIAGLQRPEAWLLAGAYWLYLAPGLSNLDRVRLAALGAAAPLLWFTVDLIVTGNPLYGFTGARSARVEAVQTFGPATESVPSIALDNMRAIVRLPVLLGGVAGAVIAITLRRPGSRMPLALLVAGAITFVGMGYAGLPLVDRFLFLPAAALAILFGLAATGWIDDRDGEAPRRRGVRVAWMVGGIALLVVLAVSVPPQVDRIQVLRDEVSLRQGAIDELRTLADSGRAGAVLRRCDVYLPNAQTVPILAYALDRSPRHLFPASHVRSPRTGAYVEPRSELVAANAFFLRTQSTPNAAAHFKPVAETRYWTVRARGCG